MTPRTTKQQATRLKFVGQPDSYVSGVPQGDLTVVDRPVSETEVTPERARELVATGLYEPHDGVLPERSPQTSEGAAAPEEELR